MIKISKIKAEEQLEKIEESVAELLNIDNCEDPKFAEIEKSIQAVRNYINHDCETSDDESVFDIRTCKECGCTDLHACPGGCHWVTDDLCSNCVFKIYVDKGIKAHCGALYQGAPKFIAEEVLSAEEVDAVIYGYSEALGFEFWYGSSNENEIDEIEKGNEILKFDVHKGGDLVGTIYYKKQ